MRSELDVKTAKAILNYLDVEDFPNPLANIISEAYAPLVNSHASNLRKVEALRDALRTHLAHTRQTIKDIGPCDHAVNICVCGLVADCDTAEVALKGADDAD